MLESAAASFGRFYAALTLGWFAMTTMPALVGVFRGSARQIGGRAIQPSVRLISCSYHMAVSFRRIAAVFVFRGVAEDQRTAM
jgi:hypothetical protein